MDKRKPGWLLSGSYWMGFITAAMLAVSFTLYTLNDVIGALMAFATGAACTSMHVYIKGLVDRAGASEGDEEG